MVSFFFLYRYLQLITFLPSILKSIHYEAFFISPREPSPPVSRVYSAKIRRVDNLFIAGKMEPIARVFQPYDDAYNETTTSFENYLLQQYFKKSIISILP